MTATHVISTAGHVDHGKSTLVLALTGTDPDRFAEEKARGLTIDLGFASTSLPSGRTIAIIDVPGHVRFLKNMLAGVGAVDACVFVVAAPEGWKPQSEEHLRILELLEVSHGLVALTQIDLVDEELAELARLDIEEHIEGSFLEGCPVIGVNSVGGEGLDDLRASLDALLDQTPTAVDNDRPRLWIDRCFAAKGSGTVVTGTLTGGSISVEDQLIVEPGSSPIRVRAIQSLHTDVDSVGPGSRVALNVTGVSHTDIGRGHVITRAGQWHLTRTFDASLNVLESLDHAVSRRGAHVVYLGSGEHPAVLRVLGPDAINPGAAGSVRLRIESALPLLPGDRFVLRESGRAETIGGGEVLDVDPIVAAARAQPSRSVDRVIAERGWVDVDSLALLTGERRDPDVGVWAVAPDVLAETSRSLAARVEEAGPLGLDLAQLDVRERAVVATIEGVEVDGNWAKLGDVADPLADHPFLAALEAEPFTPPAPDGVDRAELRELVNRGLVVHEGGIWFAASAIERAAGIVATMLRDQPDGITVAEVRERWGTTRKYAMPLLGRLDSTGMTRRRDDVRIAGPRLPKPAD